MNRPVRFEDLNSQPDEAPMASRMLRLAATAVQVVMLTLATVAAGLYIFPLH